MDNSAPKVTVWHHEGLSKTGCLFTLKSLITFRGNTAPIVFHYSCPLDISEPVKYLMERHIVWVICSAKMNDTILSMLN